MAEATGGGGVFGRGDGSSFPVVFFDGECETGIGNVVIHPAMDFKAFHAILGRRIGISPLQFSVYIVDSKNPRNRALITGKVNFSAISCKKDCFFLVVLKRSRRSGTRKGKNDGASPELAMKREPPANAMLLRREVEGGNNSMDARVFTGLDEFERRVRDLQVEKERYLVNMGSVKLRMEMDSKGLACEECEKEKVAGSDGEFHLCVNDPVVFGFRTNVGPIARPGRAPLRKNRF